MGSIRFGAIGLLVANMVGAGLFALPYVFATAGWGYYLAYLIGLGALLTFVHALYGQALDRVRGAHRLTGLVQMYLPKRVFNLAAFVILAGLLFTLVVYIILGGTFLSILFPGLSRELGWAILWILGSVPLFMKLKKFVGLEFVGSLAMGAIILLILIAAENLGGVFQTAAFKPEQLFLPFGPILFALAGWTAIGPMREYERGVGVAHRPGSLSIILGTLTVVLLYIAFAVGIVSLAPTVTPDTLSGLADWPPVFSGILAFLGLIAIWTSYMPVAEEARDAFTHDFAWSHVTATMFVALVPILFIIFGFTDFLTVLGLAGGVFLAFQYIFIVFVTKSAVRVPPGKRLLLNLAILIFLLGAVYEVYAFVVR